MYKLQISGVRFVAIKIADIWCSISSHKNDSTLFKNQHIINDSDLNYKNNIANTQWIFIGKNQLIEFSVEILQQ